MMDFSTWLQHQMAEQGVDQSGLARRARQAGYSITRHTINRIVNNERDAGIEACIAISYGLRIPREEVFRARGWLLRKPEEMFPPGTDPHLVDLGRRVSGLPEETRRQVLDTWDTALRTVERLTAQAHLYERVREVFPDELAEVERQVLEESRGIPDSE